VILYDKGNRHPSVAFIIFFWGGAVEEEPHHSRHSEARRKNLNVTAWSLRFFAFVSAQNDGNGSVVKERLNATKVARFLRLASE
jgi:hypothetical protein